MKKTFLKAAIPTIAMLLVAIMSLAGVTYAWFTQTNTATVEQLDISVTNASAMHVTTAATQTTFNTWSSIITKDAINGSYDVHKPVNLTTGLNGLSSDGTVTGGNLTFYRAEIDESSEAMIKNPVLASDDYYKFDIYVWNDSPSAARTITLKGSTVTGDAGGAVRIGLYQQGYASGYSGASTIPTLTTTNADNKAQIWEPNAGTHTDMGTAHALTIGAANAAADSINGYKYYALTGKSFTGAVNEYGGSTPDMVLMDASAQGTKLMYVPEKLTFTVPASSVMKVTVVIWLEGQDVDCTNGITGEDLAIKLTLDGTGN